MPNPDYTDLEVKSLWESLTSRVDFVPATGAQRPWEVRNTYIQPRTGDRRTVFLASFKTEKAAQKKAASTMAYRETLLAKLA